MEREDNIVTLTRIQYNPEDKVIRIARKVNRKVHFASLMDSCPLKHTEFNTHHQTYPGHVVFLNRTLTSHDAHVTHMHIFSCVAQVPTRLKDTWIVLVRAFFEVLFRGTLLDALLLDTMTRIKYVNTTLQSADMLTK